MYKFSILDVCMQQVPTLYMKERCELHINHAYSDHTHEDPSPDHPARYSQTRFNQF